MNDESLVTADLLMLIFKLQSDADKTTSYTQREEIMQQVDTLKLTYDYIKILESKQC